MHLVWKLFSPLFTDLFICGMSVPASAPPQERACPKTEAVILLADYIVLVQQVESLRVWRVCRRACRYHPTPSTLPATRAAAQRPWGRLSWKSGRMRARRAAGAPEGLHCHALATLPCKRGL